MTYNIETITVKFNSKIVTDADDNFLKTEETSTVNPYFYVVLSVEEKAQAKAQSVFGIMSTLSGFLLSLLIVFILGQTIEASWLLLATVQLMSLIPLINLNVPAIFREFSKHMAVLHGEAQFIPNIFEATVFESDPQPFNEYFALMNFPTQYLVLNAGRKIEIWILMGGIAFISFVVYDLVGFFHQSAKISLS